MSNAEHSLDGYIKRALCREPKNAPFFTQGLKHPNAEIRTWCCKGLGWLRSSEYSSPILHTLRDTDEEVRFVAMCQLALSPPEKFPEFFWTLMSEDPVVRIRARAVRIIGFLRRPHCDRLFKVFEREKAIPVLTEFVYAFGRLGCTRTISAVTHLQRNARGSLQIECMRTLRSLSALPANIPRQLLDSDPLVRRDTLLAMTPEMLRANQVHLSSLIRDPNPAVRCGLILALGRLQATWSESLLALMTDDPHAEVQYHLRRALSSSKLAEAGLDKESSKEPVE